MESAAGGPPLTNLWGEIIVKHSVLLGTALTTVMLVALPFLGSPYAGSEVVVTNDSMTDSSRAEAGAIVGEPHPSPTTGLDFADASTGAEERAQVIASAEGAVEGNADTTGSATGSGSSTGSSTVSTGSAGTSTTSTKDDVITLPVVNDVQEPAAPACPAAISGSTPGAPSRTSPLGVAGTTSGDLQSFASRYNEIRVANCLPPVPFANIRYDSCMEDRLFWMAEDPSEDPMSAWGHIGSVRSDGVPSVGCDGNLAGGSNNTGVTVAQKWWDSSGHRTSLYKPSFTGSTSGVCILFAMTHGGVPNEPYSFTRAAARWTTC